jgi:steroid delta-isomerase-like uncharacterized protein
MSNQGAMLVRRWFDEVWTQGKADTIDQLMSADCVVHGLADGPLDQNGFKQFYAAYRNAFPDVSITVEQTVSEGDLVAVRWSGTGTHKGGGLGFPATNRPAQFKGMTFVRIQNGKLVEGWNIFDQFAMFTQLGIVKLPA